MSGVLGICLGIFSSLQAQFPSNRYMVHPSPYAQAPEELEIPQPPPIVPPPARRVELPLETQPLPAKPRSPLLPERAADILDFWFGILPSATFFPVDKIATWFGASPEIDSQIQENFTQDVLNALRGEYNGWRETPQGRLALILLLDQFPRHIYRYKPQQFMFDRMARALVLEGMQRGDDQALYPVERAFFYLPLEHAEDLQMQNLSVTSYQKLLETAPQNMKMQIESFLRYAILHQQQIARFGRFPHRNAILGRESTPEEVVFLSQWGKPSF